MDKETIWLFSLAFFLAFGVQLLWYLLRIACVLAGIVLVLHLSGVAIPGHLK